MTTRPTDPYSSDWPAYWLANPHLLRSAGAEAAAAVSDDNADPLPAPDGDKDDSKADVGDDDLRGAQDLLEDDWRADLPDDLKKTAERFTSKEDAIRAITAFQKREGQIRVPGKDATDEEHAAYRKAVGVPEKPDGYEFPKLPEAELTDEVKTSREAWSQRFHELSVPKDTAKALIENLRQDIAKSEAAQVEADKAFAKTQEEALRSEWKGDEFDKNKALANRAFAEIANRSGLKLEALTKIETKDGRFLMDRAEMLKLFATIGREMAEGTLGPALSEDERETVDDEIRGVRKQIEEAQAEGNTKRANQLFEKEQKLIARRDGNQAIVGAAGRSV